jgi:hypothetical protein
MISLKATFIIALMANLASSEQQVGRSLRNNSKNDKNNNKQNTDLSQSSYPSTEDTSSYSAQLLVDYLYTYGAPSITLNTHQSNPNNACIPGIRAYTEDMTTQSTTCEWYQFWCQEQSAGLHTTNVDFASQINIKDGYMHPKMDTLILRSVDGAYEYNYQRCSDGTYEHNFQWWPDSGVPSEMVPGFHIHSLDDHYEARLMRVKQSIGGLLTSLVSAARCSYADSVWQCLKNYRSDSINRIPGVSALGYQLLAEMQHQSSFMSSTDSDAVIVLKNDVNDSYRKCIISFEGSDGLADLTEFVGWNNNPTSYCGRNGVHSGVKNELWSITHDSQYASIIKPALETCHEVMCVGHSLGGSLCNLFTMCANQGKENLENGYSDESQWDDYNTLIWTKMTSDSW